MLAILSTATVTSGQEKKSLLEGCINKELVDPWEIKETGEEFIHLALVLSGKGVDLERHASMADRFLQSLLATSHGRPIHLIFITDSSSIATIVRHVSDTVGKVLLERILINSEALNPNRKQIPKLRVEFVSQASILHQHRQTIDHMRIHFDNHQQLMTLNQKQAPGWAFVPTSRYKYDIFYLSPFYHLVFPLSHLIVMDTDTELKFPVELLHNQFSRFTSKQVVSLARDLTPFYASQLAFYKEANPNSTLGEPGSMQGVNTGVMLLRLDRMRQSHRFNQYLQHETLDRLCQKFAFNGFLGHQDWWNLIVWDDPGMLHPLPCGFNYQTADQFNFGPWKKQFAVYHTCPETVMIQHGQIYSKLSL